MGFRELAELFPAIKEAVYYFDGGDGVAMLARHAHWIPKDVFAGLNGQVIYRGFVKVYFERSNAEADLAAVWEEVRGTP